ncbi:putative disease resistance protein [Abeliophyllum distichum]|uniref:Disease resistance protein n=1 Tax=Abeliophyllum distichum TaxID=126358 RepID=A0ABD1VZI6_9LAMI
MNCGIRSLQVTQSPSEESSLDKRVPIVDEMIVELQEEIIQITSQLVEGPDNLQIISILGLAGVGKTAIAKKLYNDSKVRSHFDKLSWCVGYLIYKRRKLLKDILSSVRNLKRDEILKMEDKELAECLGSFNAELTN